MIEEVYAEILAGELSFESIGAILFLCSNTVVSCILLPWLFFGARTPMGWPRRGLSSRSDRILYECLLHGLMMISCLGQIMYGTNVHFLYVMSCFAHHFVEFNHHLQSHSGRVKLLVFPHLSISGFWSFLHLFAFAIFAAEEKDFLADIVQHNGGVVSFFLLNDVIVSLVHVASAFAGFYPCESTSHADDGNNKKKQ